jgi:hypothetical protein
LIEGKDSGAKSFRLNMPVPVKADSVVFRIGVLPNDALGGISDGQNLVAKTLVAPKRLVTLVAGNIRPVIQSLIGKRLTIQEGAFCDFSWLFGHHILRFLFSPEGQGSFPAFERVRNAGVEGGKLKIGGGSPTRRAGADPRKRIRASLAAREQRAAQLTCSEGAKDGETDFLLAGE